MKQGKCEEVSFTAKLSHKGKKAKWYCRNQVRKEVGIDMMSPSCVQLEKCCDLMWFHGTWF